MKLCSVDGCNHEQDARGYCSAHYKRWQIYGNPLDGPPMRTRNGTTQDFIDKAIAFADDRCLLWPYAHNGVGYGKVTRNGKGYLVHRIVCSAVHGSPLSLDMEAAHKCGNGHTGCVNPKHLVWKSRKDNAKDMLAHGTAQIGKKQHMARLDEDSVRFIRSSLGSLSHTKLAEQLGVSRATVTYVALGKTWRHVK